MFKLINKYIKNNAYELLLTFFLFSNLYPYTFPSWFYLISIAMIAMKMLKYKVNVVGKWQIVGVFLGAVWFSTFINMAFDLRPVLFTAIVIMVSPYVTSLRWHLYKKS